MKPQLSNWLVLSLLLIPLGSCSMIPRTRCQAAIAIATQTWDVNYYISKTSGGLNTQRIRSFQSNTLINLNGEKPVDAVSADDNGIWWAKLPPRPTIDEIDQRRDIQEQNDPPQLQRSVNYQLRCEHGTLQTDAATYREALRAIRAGQTVQVSYLGDRALKIEKNVTQ